ncbi:MAG: SUMF1/EgtB/PvdO family nonheme iron enzyme [Armatimonadota bacterium]
MRIRPLPFALLAAAVLLTAAARAADPTEGMVLVPAGPFRIGSESGSPDEKPVRTVTLPAFYIDRTEVTVEEYARFIRATRHPAPPDWPGGKPDPKRLQHPVVNVSWYDANAYARWAGKRLPTEAEWEKAARGADGRLFPWGSEWSDALANVEGDRGEQPLRPVGSYPGGASPCGALDMVGNAWEWTADWYQPYPGNPVPSIHYGEKYRAIRGSGAVYFYNSPPVRMREASIRARVQPFGRYDSLGFRCAADAAEPRRIAPAVKGPSEREKPVPPKVESPAEVAARYAKGVPIRISDTRGTARSGVATFGVPLPEGIVKDAGALRTGTPLQARPLARWRDGSLRWVLLDVPATVAANGSASVMLRWDGRGERPQPASPVRVTRDGSNVQIDTGAAKVSIDTGSTRWLRLESAGEVLDGPLEQVAATDEKGAEIPLTMQPPSKVNVEVEGPLRARVRVEGWLVDAEQKPVLRYRCRVDARAGEKTVGLVHTFTHLSPRKMLHLRRYALEFGPERRERQTVEMGGDRQIHSAQVTWESSSITLAQMTSEAYTWGRGGVTIQTRAKGWMSFGNERKSLIALRHFWEQFPTSLSCSGMRAQVGLWEVSEPFEADQGLSKTHELLLGAGLTAAERAEALAGLEEPLFGIAPADWYCATRGLGVLAPYSLSDYPQFETELEAAADLMHRSRPYGMRHFGDNYFGGPHKGENAYQNLEYDVPYNHLMQFARTGARKYLDTALVQARHQGDIDMKHDQGPQWKHSPRHTTTEAELGHVFLRGLVASTWLTGDPEGLENARILGDWLIQVVSNPRSQGNERQIGWGLYALTGIYEATWDDRYLQAMKANVDRLLAGQDSLGRFDIRYDNRISFFYGVTLSGFVKYYEVTGDERIAESVRRIVDRIHGFYPEYGGRTLEGLAWLYTRTGDPEVRLTAQRTWESTLDWRALDIGGTSIFTTRFLPNVRMLGLAPPPEWKIPATGPVEDGMHRHYYRAPSSTLYLQAVDAKRPLELVVLRHTGRTPGSVRVLDRGGKELAAKSLPATGEPLQYARLRLPAGGPFRVELKSEESRAWSLITAEPTRRVFHMPDWKHVEALTPRAYFQLPAGTRRITLTLDAQEEGFKGAVVYDPQGNVAGVLSRFIDLGDTKKYQYTLEVPVRGASTGLWSLDLQNVSIAQATGISPYIATNPEAHFTP